MPFIINVMLSSTIIAAAAFTENSFCGLDIQLNIWMGRTVNESNMLVGTNGTKAKAPITMRGAVSPTALDKANIIPVKIPAIDAGNT